MRLLHGRSAAFVIGLTAAVTLIAVLAQREWRAPEPAALAPLEAVARVSPPGDVREGLPTRSPPVGQTRAASALPPPGEVIVEVGEGGALTVLANAAPRLDVLIELARRLDFELADRVRRHPEVTLAAVDASLHEVLPLILAATPYTLRHRYDRRSQQHQLVRLEIGDEGSHPTLDEALAEVSEEGQEAKRKPKQSERVRTVPKSSSAERQAALAARAAREPARRLDRLAKLDSPDPAEREFAVLSLAAQEPEDLAILRDVIEVETDPQVRRQAVRQLGSGDAAASIPILRQTLDDPAVEVVLASIESAVRLRDPSLVADLQPLLRHDDPQVRESAGRTIELLQRMPR